MEAAAGVVVIDQLQGVRVAIGDELPGAGRTVEATLGRDDQPVSASVQAVESAAFLARGNVPEPGRAVPGRCPHLLAVAAQGHARYHVAVPLEGLDLLTAGHIPQDRRLIEASGEDA